MAIYCNIYLAIEFFMISSGPIQRLAIRWFVGSIGRVTTYGCKIQERQNTQSAYLGPSRKGTFWNFCRFHGLIIIVIVRPTKVFVFSGLYK